MNQVERMQKKIGNVSREMKTLRKNWKKKKLDIKNTILEMNSAFDGLIRHGWGNNFWVKDIPIKTSWVERQWEEILKRKKK